MRIKKFILLFLLLGVFLLSGCASTEISASIVDDSNDQFIKIPLTDVAFKMTKYSYDANGEDVNYFLVRGSDGEIRTAFDACDVCGGYKGYHQEGGDVVCDNCGRVFKIDDIGSLNAPGGCWPSFLAHKIEGDYVLINKAEIAKGAYRFA